MPIIRDIKDNDKGRAGLAAEIRTVKTNGYTAARKIDAMEKRLKEIEKQQTTTNCDINDLAAAVFELRTKSRGQNHLIAAAVILLTAAIVILTIKAFFF